MLSELDLLLDVTRRLEKAGLDYMLTGSMALNHYAQPRMTRDIDIVIALLLKDLEILPAVFGEELYFSEEAAREAVLAQSSFNVLHNESLIKVDFIIRKREDYRLAEFERRQRIEVQGHSMWIVSKTSSSRSSIGRGIPKASGSSPTWKICSPPVPILTTYKHGLKN